MSDLAHLRDAVVTTFNDHDDPMANRAIVVEGWLETLPAHARRHAFVRSVARAITSGVVWHPDVARETEAEVERISALSPEESDAESLVWSGG